MSVVAKPQGPSSERSAAVAAFPRSFTVLVLVAALLGATVSAPGLAAEPCLDIMDVEQLEPGMVGTGLTVGRGTEPEPFEVEVVDILDDALAPGVPLIIVEVDSPEIDRVGGIWAGMSGSPVYVDGQLIGAIAYGFSLAPSKLGGVTPAAQMLEVPARGAPDPAIEPAEVELSEAARARARADGVSTAQAGRMAPLEVPVQLSGLAGQRFDRAKELFEAQYPGTRVLRGAGTGAAGAGELGAETLVPGANLAVSLWYGDANAVGVGTVTTVCDGVVTAFGHPMMYAGATRMGMHAASVVRVVDDATFGPYKLANAGPVIGTVEQDRLAAVAGRLGPLPATTAITSSITNVDDGRTVDGRTDAVWPDELFAPVLYHGWTNYDLLVFDDWMTEGTAEVSWTIEGLRADGSPWSVTRANRHASQYDLSTESILESALYAQLLHDNPFEKVRVTRVDHTASAGGPYRALQILPSELEVLDVDGEWMPAPFGVAVVPGETLELRVGLRAYRGELTRVEVALDVPDDASGYGELLVTGGGLSGDVWECLYYPEECGSVPAEALDDLLAGIASAPRSDELHVMLYLYEEGWGFFPGDGEPVEEPGFAAAQYELPRPTIEVTVPLDEVVTGQIWREAFVEGGEWETCPGDEEPPFLDVSPDNVHAAAITCSAMLGLTVGISEDPPLFGPDRAVRRDQAASFLARVLERGPRALPEADTSGFEDLEGNVHREAIERLFAAGIVNGRSATTYDPSAAVTREQVTSLLVEALRWSLEEPFEADGGPHFDDVDGVHAANIDLAYELGLVQGREDGTFDPTGHTRRDQMASLVLRLYGWVRVG